MGWLESLLGAKPGGENRRVDSLNQQAVQAMARHQLDQAEKLLQEAVQLGPNHAAAHHNLGVVHLNRKRYALALKYMRRAVRLDPGDVESRIGIARIYDDSGQKDEALAEYARICEATPNDWRSQISLGNALLQRERVDEAIEHLERAVQLENKEELTHLMMATACERSGDLERAIREYRAVRNTTRLGQNRETAKKKIRELQLRQVQERAHAAGRGPSPATSS